MLMLDNIYIHWFVNLIENHIFYLITLNLYRQREHINNRKDIVI